MASYLTQRPLMRRCNAALPGKMKRLVKRRFTVLRITYQTFFDYNRDRASAHYLGLSFHLVTTA